MPKKRKSKTSYALFILLIAYSLGSALSAELFPVSANNPREVKKGRLVPEIELVIYFSNPNLPEWANSCGAGEFVKRKVVATKRPADTALRLLFAGPTPEEKARGMEAIANLGRYYLGVSIRRGIAVVNFRPGAEEHLHVSGAACQQEQVLTPIDKTLKQFSGIRSVKYAINGKIITVWDA